MKTYMIPPLPLILIAAILTMGCQSFHQKDSASNDRTAACIKADEIEEECSYIDIDCGEPVPITCSYEEVSVNSNSCSCDQRIYRAICDAGITDSLEVLEAGIMCTTASDN